jgi:hypothetical protein
MLQATIQSLIEPPWTQLQPVLVGDISPRLGTPGLYVLVKEDGRPLFRIDVYDNSGCCVFEQVEFWRDFLAIGAGESVHLVRLNDRETRTVRLGSYFGRLYTGADWLLIASGERLLRVSVRGEILWSTETVGLDGVVVQQVKDGIIYGEGEWDPPGGWRPFQARLDTGAVILPMTGDE